MTGEMPDEIIDMINTLPDGMRAEVHAITVDVGSPINDQIAAQVRVELDWFIKSMRHGLSQGPDVEAMTAFALLVNDSEDGFPRDRLSSLLAGALVRLARQELDAENR